MSEPRRCPQCGIELSADVPGGLCPGCLLKQGFESGPERLAETTARNSRFTAPPPGELDQRFPQLEVLELLGQGGMGAVYKARQPTLDRLVALKILPVEVGRDPNFAERFAREARALARLSHPNIVAIYDFGQLDGLYYFVMEYVHGLSLRQLVESRRLSPAQALTLVPQICEALQFAHDEGIVHRDVKPENILLDKRGRVKIADFGLAKLLGRAGQDATLTRAEQVMGTPLYMAPEQMQGSHAVDHRADIYSLGVVFYEMLTGELPVGRFAPPSQKVQVDVRLDEVVLRSLEHEPDRRYQHASDVKTDVESIANSPTSAATAPVAFTAPTACPDKVRAPAIGLMIAGVLNWVWMPLGGGAIGYAYLVSPHSSKLDGALLALAAVAILILSACIILAARNMMRCRAYPLAITGSILAMLVAPGNVIGLPIGIWALVVLLRRDVKAAFTGARLERRHVRRAAGQSRRRLNLLPIVKALAVAGCLLGAGSAFLPWAELVSGTFRTVHGDWTFTSPWQLPQPAAAIGFAWWQGMLVCFAFLTMAMLIIGSLAWQVSRWRLLAAGLGALVVVALAASFLAEFSRGNLLAEPLWTAA
ncbi:MAG: serine/threonine-protein kinase, partial [Candidatus Saccharimonadales bacterium]